MTKIVWLKLCDLILWLKFCDKNSMTYICVTKGLEGEFLQEVPPKVLEREFWREVPPKGLKGEFWREGPPKGIDLKFWREVPPKCLKEEFWQEGPAKRSRGGVLAGGPAKRSWGGVLAGGPAKRSKKRSKISQNLFHALLNNPIKKNRPPQKKPKAVKDRGWWWRVGLTAVKDSMVFLRHS